MHYIRINKSEALPVHMQLVEQLKFQIESGVWEAGAQLPSVREFATSLKLNYNTVRAVYQQLEREHYVITDQGRGTFVTKPLPLHEINQYAALIDLVDEALIQAQTSGISLDLFARTAYARAKLYAPIFSELHVLFAECNRPDLDYFKKALERASGASLEGYMLDELPRQDPTFFARFDLVTTTLSHVAELQEIVGTQRRVWGLRIEPSYTAVLAHLASLPKAMPVGLLCATQQSAEKMKRAVLRAGLTHINPLTAGVTNARELEAVFTATEHIYVSRYGLSLHQGAWPGPQQVHEYITELDPMALRLLYHQLLQVHMDAHRGHEGNRQ